jgi:hypothetical protein
MEDRSPKTLGRRRRLIEKETRLTSYKARRLGREERYHARNVRGVGLAPVAAILACHVAVQKNKTRQLLIHPQSEIQIRLFVPGKRRGQEGSRGGKERASHFELIAKKSSETCLRGERTVRLECGVVIIILVPEGWRGEEDESHSWG